MCFGSKWMLMWRSGPCCSSAITRPSIATMRIVVVAVGRVKPPFADDVAHYEQLLGGHTRLELVEGREDAALGAGVTAISAGVMLYVTNEDHSMTGYQRSSYRETATPGLIIGAAGLAL